MSTTLAEGMTLYATPREQAWPHWSITIHRAPGGNLPVLVRFVRRDRMVTTRRIASWLPTVGGWNLTSWAPNGKTSGVPAAVLAAVETALRGGAAASTAYPPLADQNCGNCRFCCPTGPSGPRCRRHAPIPGLSAGWYWPDTHYGNWCGEWAPREAQQ